MTSSVPVGPHRASPLEQGASSHQPPGPSVPPCVCGGVGSLVAVSSVPSCLRLQSSSPLLPARLPRGRGARGGLSRGARPRLWLPPVGFLWGTRRGDRAPLAPDRAVPMAVTLPAGRRSPSIQTPTRERSAACGASQPGRPTSDSCGQTLAEPAGGRGARSAHSRLLGGPQSWLRGTDFQRLSRGQHLSAPRLPLVPVQKRGAHGAFVESLFAVSAQVS